MRRILHVVSHFNLSVLANETSSVSLRREIDSIFGAVRRCFDHVLSKFSGFSWERTGVFYFYSLHVSIWCCKFKFKLEILEGFLFANPTGSVEHFKNYILREIPKTGFMDFGLLYENDKGGSVVLNDVRMADIRLA